MSEQSGTPRRRFAVIGVLALVAGVLAGVVGIYVMGAGSGNQALAGNCPARADIHQALIDTAKGEVAAVTPLDTPFDASTLAFRTADDAPVTLAAFAGKTLLVNLWATWCVPCREEMPALNTLQKDMGSDAFQVVAINIDTGTSEKPKAFLFETGVDQLGLYRDSSMAVFNTMKKQGLAFGLPVTLLVDDKGCLLGSMNGPAEWDSAAGKALVKAATNL